MYSCNTKLTYENNCQLTIDSNFIKHNLNNLIQNKNKRIDSLIVQYENNQLIGKLTDSVGFDRYPFIKTFSLEVPEFKKRHWLFYIAKEILDEDSYMATIYLVTTEKATMDNIFEIAYITNSQMLSSKLSTCFLDTSVIITKVIGHTYDIIINEKSYYKYDSLIFYYAIEDQNLVLKEEKRIVKHFHY
jgi:hypothetical protein